MSALRKLLASAAALACLCLLPQRAAALPAGIGLSQAVMTAWTDREGLPSDTILDVCQDGQGYVWLASYEGLVRFDGERFALLGPENGGFVGKSARVLAAGPDGRLWVGTNTAGLHVREGEGFRVYGAAEGLPDLSVRALAFDRGGRVWAGTAGGVARLEGGAFVPSPAKIGIANFLLALPDGGVLAGSNLQGLWVVDESGTRPYLPGSGLEAYSFSAAYLDTRNELWLGTSQGVLLRVARNEIVERYEPDFLRGASVNEFYADPEGTLWIATDKGVVYRRGAEYRLYAEENGLPSNVVSSLWRDGEGSLWVGTERGGLLKFSPGKFVNFSEREGLVDDAVNAVAEDIFGSLWVATDEGLGFSPSKLDPYAAGGERRRSVDALLADLKGKRVRQVRAEPDGSLWFSTYSEYALLAFGPGSRRSVLSKKDGLPIDRVRFSYRAPGGDLWIGTTAGPARLREGRLELFGAESGLANLFILCAVEDSSGGLWLGSDGGGAALLEGGRFRSFTTAEGLSGNVVFRIVEDSGRRLWFCTSEGLSLRTEGGFVDALAALGLPAESVFQVLEDPEGRLWIIQGRRVIVTKAEELARAAKEPGAAPAAYRAYDRLDGLAGQLTANAWAYMSPKGVIHLPTLKGLSTYNPQSVPMNDLPPPVLVEEILVDGVRAKPLAPKAAKAGDLPRFELAPGTRRLSVRYTALSFMVPQKVSFRYMLEGYDKDWIAAGPSREISYTSLPPGEYRFRVRAENNDGIRNEEGAAVLVVQRPRFTQTWPFYLLLALLLASSGFLVAWLRVRRLEARGRELRRLVEERTVELEREKEQSEALLRNVLPGPIAEELKERGRAEPKVYPEVTVLFADIVGFTAKAAAMSPEALIEELNALFSLLDDIMAKHDCERIKTIGDGYLAVCGLPLPEPRHARKAAEAAVEALGALRERYARSPRPWKMRMALHSGPVVGAVVGVKKYIFDVFGDTVNTASRLQAGSVPLGLTLSEETARLLGSDFPLQPRPPRQAKGKGELKSYYLRWTGAAAKEGGLERYRAARVEYEAGHWAACISLLGGIDLTIVEPELGRAAEALRGNAFRMLGDLESASAAWDSAKEFGRV